MNMGPYVSYLVHFTGELRQKLNAHHALFGRAAQELGHIADRVAKHKILLLRVEPAQLGDAAVQRDEALHHEWGQLRLRPQVRQHIVPAHIAQC